MDRPTKHRRRYHTDRVVRNRRARYKREDRSYGWYIREHPEWYAKRLSWGYLSQTDPWDCGNSDCGACRDVWRDSERARVKREWKRDWGLL